MTLRLLLDTHIALWLDSGDERLRRNTRDCIDQCWRDGGLLSLSAVSAWEIAVLVDAGRVTLDLPPADWVRRFVERPGFESVPLDTVAATRAYALPGQPHRDPGDRLLIATAISLRCPLVTYDARILAYAAQGGEAAGLRAISQ